MRLVSAANEVSDFSVIYQYKDFSSTSPFVHYVPVHTRNASWSFQADNKYPDTCQHYNVTV